MDGENRGCRKREGEVGGWHQKWLRCAQQIDCSECEGLRRLSVADPVVMRSVKAKALDGGVGRADARVKNRPIAHAVLTGAHVTK